MRRRIYRSRIGLLSALMVVMGLGAPAAMGGILRDLEVRVGKSVAHRAPRVGHLKMDPAVDRAKPLAQSDHAGYALVGDTLIGPMGGQSLVGMSVDSRHVLWSMEMPTAMTGQPGVFGGTVVVGFRNGQFLKIDASTGRKIWEVQLSSFAERAMSLSGKTLLVVTVDQVTHAVDFASGQLMWQYEAGYPDGLNSRMAAPPVVNGGVVLVGTAAGDIHAVAIDGGKPLWQFTPGYNDARFHDIVGQPTVVNGILIVTRVDGVVAAVDFRGADRLKVWDTRLASLTTSMIHEGRVFAGGLNGDITALDVTTGQQVWRAVTGQAISGLMVADRTVVATGSNGRVTALDVKSGEILWDDNPGEDISSPPFVIKDTVWVSTGFSNIYGYRLRD